LFSELATRLNRVRAAWSGSNGGASYGAGYDVATSRGEGRRRTAVIEHGSEDEILNASRRLKVLNLTRDGMRNAPQVRAIVQQLRVLVVGLQGGKLTLTTADQEWNKAGQDFFANWSRRVDFIDETGLNDCLKLIITALAAEGGDYAMLFDDGTITGGQGTGRVRFFESDNIANMTEADFAARFPGYVQSQGLIYDTFGRWVGIIVSGKKRGKQIFSKDECFTLVRDPGAEIWEAPWYYGKRKWRLLQGRGISPQTVAIAALLDMYEIVSAEIQCGKLNSKIFAQVIDTLGVTDGTDGSEDVDSGATDTDAEAEAEAEATASETAEEAVLDVTNFEANAGAQTLNMPYGFKMDLLDTKRPNKDMIQFVEWLNGGAAAVHGLARVYSGLKAETSYTAFRGEQTISWASVEEFQKELERGPLDWLGVHALRWGIATGQLDAGPEGWESALAWQWPQMREVNEVDAQTAVSAKLKNYLATYQSLLGPNWRQILTQVASEMEWFKEQGMVHPAMQTVSGQIVETSQSNPAKRGKDEEK
jgi:hypothetical protein